MAAIASVSLAQNMRPGEIDAITQLNEVITAVNALDVTGITSRLTQIEASLTTLNTSVYGDAQTDGLATRVSDLETDTATAEADITQIKQTLYTPLNQTVPEPSNGGN